MSAYALDRKALIDLNEILEYVDLRNGEEAAQRLEQDLIDAFERLAATPGLGHRRPDLTSRPQFFYLVDPYLIVFARGHDPLRIIAILHSKRNLRKLLRPRPLP